MNLLNTVFEKLGSGLDHVGSTLEKLVSNNVTYTGEPAPNPMVANVVSAIAHNETRGVKGDPYAFHQPSGSSTMGNSMGKYQTTEGELKTWGKEFLGETITPEQYAQDPKLQDKYITSKVQKLMDAGASPAEVLALQRGGLTGYADPKVRAKKVAQRQGYVDSGLEYLKSLGDTK